VVEEIETNEMNAPNELQKDLNVEKDQKDQTEIMFFVEDHLVEASAGDSVTV